MAIRISCSFIAALLFMLLISNAGASESGLYVSPHGNDSWSGKQASPNTAKTDGPFATLERARDAAREMRKNQPDAKIHVIVRGGEYPLTHTLVFGLEDSSDSGTLAFKAYPGETPVISSGVAIPKWTKVTHPISGLPEKAIGKIWEADMAFYEQAKALIPKAKSETGEVLKGGHFDHGTAGWFFHSKDSSATLSADDREIGSGKSAKIAITKSPNLVSALQFQQKFALKKGAAYAWKFTAAADRRTTMTAQLLIAHDPWTALIDKPISLSTTSQTFEFKCTSDVRDIGVVTFMMGNSGEATIWIDDVSLVEKPANDLAETGSWRFRTLYDSGRRLPRARGKGFVPTNTTPDWSSPDNSLFQYPKGALRNWPNLADIDLLIRPTAAWVFEIIPLDSVDETKLEAHTALQATCGIAQVHHPNITESLWVENAIDYLDHPGGWVLNTREKKLYFWPEGDEPSKNIHIPMLTELVRIEGKIDHDGPRDVPVKNITFDGFTFTQADRAVWLPDQNIAQTWGEYDYADCAVRVRGGEGCAFDNCIFTNSGGGAVRFDLRAKKNRVSGSRIEHIGGGGVILCGYRPGTKDVNRGNEISNNLIHDVGEISWQALPVLIFQSGGQCRSQ